ncbi:hypothetical protein Q9K02_05890 [Qipengyuania sp. G39]|uniref:Uncharacterized protein n=1 Tax=Qipengyuania profundimaris TaxID=3067652 RepID=A0ABT9HPI6_9SPHN|nr:hypothetical protein [Qipengyuania sp. G39]MDP4574668.1 hypothetical protein [Qipengyuania sp. G39]
MRLSGILAAAAITISCVLTPPANARSSIVPLFLTAPEEGEAADGFVEENDAFYSVPVVSGVTVTLAQRIAVPGSVITRYVAADTVLFQATSTEGIAYCASSNKNPDDPPQYDRMVRVFVCLRDDDRDGAFDRALTTGGEAAAFPVMQDGDNDWRALDEPVPYTLSTTQPYPVNYSMQFVLRRAIPKKDVVFVALRIANGDDAETISYDRYELDSKGELELFGGQFRVTGMTKDGAQFEMMRPIPIRPVILGKTPARAFYVPG